MGYIKINNIHIYQPDDKFKEILVRLDFDVHKRLQDIFNSYAMDTVDYALKGLVTILQSGQSGTKENRKLSQLHNQANQLIHDYLLKLCNLNFQKFYNEWVYFDFKDKEASDNANELVSTYCWLYGFEKSRFGNYMSGNYDTMISLKKKKIAESEGKQISLIFNEIETKRIVGDLKKFIIFHQHFCLVCTTTGVDIHQSDYVPLKTVKLTDDKGFPYGKLIPY